MFIIPAYVSCRVLSQNKSYIRKRVWAKCFLFPWQLTTFVLRVVCRVQCPWDRAVSVMCFIFCSCVHHIPELPSSEVALATMVCFEGSCRHIASDNRDSGGFGVTKWWVSLSTADTTKQIKEKARIFRLPVFVKVLKVTGSFSISFL